VPLEEGTGLSEQIEHVVWHVGSLRPQVAYVAQAFRPARAVWQG
jgi:hypothetical protein